MIEFKDITLADKDLIQSFTLGSLRRNCDLSFANLCSWIFLYLHDARRNWRCETSSSSINKAS